MSGVIFAVTSAAEEKRVRCNDSGQLELAVASGGGVAAPSASTSVVQAQSTVLCAWQVTVTTSITPIVPAWAPGTAYLIGEVVTNDSGKMYRCSVAGTSAGSGGPTGTGSGAITDNTATWLYVSGFAQGFLLVNTDSTNAVYTAQHAAPTTTKASAYLPPGGVPKSYPYANPSLFYARAGASVVITVEAAL
jgi:hypothetical protein